MTDRYADLRAALDAGPTPGPWQTYEKCVFFGREGGFSLIDCPRPSENAAHIAAANPETIRALLADYDRMRDALLWTAGALQMACVVDVIMGEADGISINNETRTVVQILDAADAALAQEQGGSDGNPHH